MSVLLLLGDSYYVLADAELVDHSKTIEMKGKQNKLGGSWSLCC